MRIDKLISKELQIKDLELNKGQVEGLPKNPRLIKDHRYAKLKQSIEDSPEMLSLRELIVYPYEGKFIVIAGNMRLSALKDLKFTDAPCKILPMETPIEKLKEYAIKDNVSFGENDWDVINAEWDTEQLEEWGQEIEDWDDQEEEDYGDLDPEDKNDLAAQANQMQQGVKKAIMIEFEQDDYQEAFDLIKFWREREAYVGAMIIEYLKDEKNKISE